MITADVRLRAIALTLLLVVMVAAVVSFWPEQKTSTVVSTPVQPKAEDELLKQFGGKTDSFKPNLDELIEECVSRRSLLVFSALLHDSGKTQTMKIKDIV